MGVTTTLINKPLNPRAQDASPLAYNRAKLFSGKALDFDGVNDYVDLDGFTMVGNVATIVFQAKFDSTGYVTDINTQRFIIQNHNTFGFRVYNNNNWTAYGDTDRAELNFYAVVSDGTTQRVYYNGIQLGDDATITALDWDSATQIKLGSDNAGSGSFFDGQLAGFKIFNTALTAAQVADLYNNPEKVVPTGVANTALKLWLPMQEGAGTTAYDGSSKENGPDLIVNGDFATDSDWTKGAGWSIGGGVASHDASLGPGDLYQDFNLNVGSSYKITIEITATDTTELYFMTDPGDYVEVTGSPIGVHSHVFVADESSHRVGVRGSGNWDGSVDNITLEELNFANHGTISGATYVHGIGAPVSQTAVIDWNKGVNELTYSEQIDNAIWQKVSSGAGSVTPIVTANYAIAPDGTQTAERIQLTRGTGAGAYSYVYQSITATSGQTYSWSVWLKSLSGTPSVCLVFDGSSYGNIVTLTNEWARYTFTGVTGGAGIQSTFLLFENLPTTSLTADFLAWGAQVNAGSLGPYVRTGATAQPTPVLLPAGLTTGRDITGVNLFENVRKQSALNLDGQSWAEVHDNASVDVSAFTLEGWIYTNSITSDNRILSKWFSGYPNRTFQFTATNDDLYLYTSNGSSANSTSVLNVLSLNNWYHCVATYDGANLKIYLDGVLKATTASTITLKDSTEPVYIGAYVGSLDPSDNTTAQPRIYNRALTAEEVQRNYNAGKNIYS